ncbi:ribonuclease H-like domain-containing protein [Rhizophagus irregularis DAOM 181602=DAOM 197198]|nr:ribonuclease H-like domain-containing protein [Rhizophagus irregularis DAOM 181602=DAOM 197198]
MVIFYSHGKTYNNNNYKGPIPKWCNNLIGIYVLSDNLRLTHPLKDVISVINRTHKSPRITPAITSPKCELDRTLEQPTQKPNAGSHSKDPIIVDHKFFNQTSLGLIKWTDIYVIDRNVRKWSDNVINPQIFNSMINNSSLSLKVQIIHGDIDWNLTREWINFNPLDSPTSAKGSKIKKCNFIYPTADIQQRNYPRLYPSGNIPY